ncbi:uncharacterized mitochondrial protein-like protein [Tanacetum coccineum]
MNQFCEIKGIKREFSVARTPQQNRVAEKKNITLIEAARTMLADSKLPTTFWAEQFNTHVMDSPDARFKPLGDEEKKERMKIMSPIPTTRIHKDHPFEQIIRDLHSAPQTRRMTKNVTEHGMYSQGIAQKGKPRWIKAMQEELLQFKLQQVWTLVDLPHGKRAIGTKWVYRNKKDERGIVIRNNARLVAQGYTQEEGIDYDETVTMLVRSLDRKSTIGDCQFLRSRLISWQCKKQTVVANSTTEAEYVAASNCRGQVFASMRRQGKDFSGTFTPLFPSMLASQAVEGEADEIVHEERRDSVERAATTTASLDAEQDSGNIIRTQSMATLNEPIPQETGLGSGPRRLDTILGDRPAQTRFERLSKQSNDLPLSRVNTLESGEDSMKLNELMEIYTRLSKRVLALENIKTAQNLEIINLKRRVKKLEKKKKARNPQLKRRLIKVRIESFAEKSLGDQEDAFKQKRNVIDQDEEISWFQEDAETQGRYGHDFEVNTASTSITTASINITNAKPVTTASAPITIAGVSVSTDEPSTPPKITILIEDEYLIIAQTLMKMRSVKSKEKSKEKGVSNETTIRPTRGEVARRLEAHVQAEYEEEEERVARQREEEDNLISWNNTQAMMEAHYELAQRLQSEEQGELTIKERSKLFIELMDKRKKHFAKLKAEEIRRKPPTKAQKRN